MDENRAQKIYHSPPPRTRWHSSEGQKAGHAFFISLLFFNNLYIYIKKEVHPVLKLFVLFHYDTGLEQHHFCVTF